MKICNYLGILGGLGPMSTVYFCELLNRHTAATRDSDHIDMLISSRATTPDRTTYILDKNAPDPLPVMLSEAHRLERAGVDLIVMPCNTAHYFYDGLTEGCKTPILNIIDETTAHLLRIGTKTFGLLATEGTVESGVFQGYFERYGVRCMAPDPDGQARISHLIYDCVKANQPYDPQEFLDVAQSLHDAGCDAVVVGCTELSVIYQDLDERPEWLFDSLDVLADRCVQIYLASRAKGGHVEM
jgi:aspartate racemase